MTSNITMRILGIGEILIPTWHHILFMSWSWIMSFRNFYFLRNLVSGFTDHKYMEIRYVVHILIQMLNNN